MAFCFFFFVVVHLGVGLKSMENFSVFETFAIAESKRLQVTEAVVKKDFPPPQSDLRRTSVTVVVWQDAIGDD